MKARKWIGDDGQYVYGSVTTQETKDWIEVDVDLKIHDGQNQIALGRWLFVNKGLRGGGKRFDKEAAEYLANLNTLIDVLSRMRDDLEERVAVAQDKLRDIEAKRVEAEEAAK